MITACTKKDSECLKNAKDDEPIFVLRSTDISSPKIVLLWIIENIETCPEEKLRKAFESAMAMKNYKNRKNAD